MKIRLIALTWLAVCGMPLLSHAASFDCKKARSGTEKMICSTPALSKLDEDLADAYKTATAKPGEREFVRAWQKAWLDVREQCGEPDCMKKAYTEQVGELKAWAGRDAASAKYSGKYERVAGGKRDRQAAQLTLVELGQDRVRLIGAAIYEGGNAASGQVNTGEVRGLARVAAGKIAYRDGPDSDCKFTVTLGAAGLAVSGDTGECGGVNVTFNGEYRKVIDPKLGEPMKAKNLLAMLVTLAAAQLAQAACAPGTKTVFACPTTNGKFVQVCDAGKTLTYSFGKPGAAPEIDLQVPRAQASTTQWQGAGSNISYSVEIPNGKTTYSVFISMDRMSAKHAFEAGIGVYADDKRLATVKCTGKNVEHDLEGIGLKPTQW